MMLFAITDLIGHFHPVLVHLPIGMLLLALLFQWLSGKEKYRVLQPAIPITFLAGSIGAILSCISGWILSLGGEYDETVLWYHQWMGIGVALTSVVGYYLTIKPNRNLLHLLCVLLFVLIMVAGHLGGTLTHGDGFLTKGLSVVSKDSAVVKKIITNAQEAVVYTDMIQPVLQQKCYGCHAAAKQKGGLRLDSKEWILKGGKEGRVVFAGNPGSSELYKRVISDPLEEKHMPPKGKPQLTEQEMVLLHWWISTGVNFEGKAKDLEQPAPVKVILTALEKNSVSISKKADVPAEPVDKAAETTLEALQKNGVTILPVAINSNYLTANLVNLTTLTKETENLLLSVKSQLIWLRMPGIRLSDSSWQKLASCTKLTRLSIEHSNISDSSLGYLRALTHLQYLNLVDTHVSANGFMQLKSLQDLAQVYLAQTSVSRASWPELQKNFPKVMIDSGGYTVTSLPTDTQLLKPKPVKK